MSQQPDRKTPALGDRRQGQPPRQDAGDGQIYGSQAGRGPDQDDGGKDRAGQGTASSQVGGSPRDKNAPPDPHRKNPA